MASGEREEQYLLRFEDPAVAARVRAVLREEDGAAPADAEMALDWDGEKKKKTKKKKTNRPDRKSVV